MEDKNTMIYIFIGYLFIFFQITTSINISGVPVLPNIIGNIFIIVGINKLSDRSSNISKAKSWTIVILIYSLLIYVGFVVGMDFSSLPFLILNLITVFVKLYILYLIDIGIHEIEQTQNIILGSKRLLQIWKVQFLTWTICSLVSLDCVGSLKYVTSIFTYTAFIINIVFLINFYKAKKIYDSVQ